MDAQSLILSLKESVASGAGVKSLFGEPLTVNGKTLIPVAQVSFGFGAGAGSKPGASEAEPAREQGGGGGGGVRAMPMGVVEVSSEATRFVPIAQGRKLAAAAGIGFLAGMWFGRRR